MKRGFPTAKLLLSILLGAWLLLALACGRKEAGGQAGGTPGTWQPSYGDSIVEASIGDISGLIPNITSDSASHEVGSLIYNGLVKYNKDYNLVSDIAESWDISKDGLVITFHLRKGVKWHDGVEFTAEDALFTYKTMVDPKTPTAYSEDFRQVKKIEVLDRYTFRVSYAEPFAPALASWGIWMLPKHLLEGRDLKQSPLSKNPIGTGPYKFKEWKTGEKVVLETNPDYFEGRPYIDRVIYRIIPDQATIFLELKAKGIDYTGLTPIQYTKQTEYPDFRRSFSKYRYLANGYTYLGFNLLDPRFQDKRVRQAIAHAINKQELIEGVRLGLGQEATGPYKPGTWYYNPDVERYPFNPAKARALLGEAGWRDTNGDGILDRNREPFKFTILTNQGNEDRKKTAEIIQRRLREVGILVDIRIIEWAAFINEFIKKRKFEAIILGWGLSPDPDQYDIWHSSKTGPDELNHISYKNPEVDRLLDLGRHTFDQEKRKAYYYKLQEILAEEQPIVFLFVPDALPVVASRFKGIEPAPAGIAYNFVKWYVPKELQRYTK